MLAGAEVRRIAEPRTVRLVSTARLRPPVLDGLVPDEEMDALLEIEAATSARLLAEERGAAAIDAREFVFGVPHAAFINAAFAYARPRAPNRFNGADRGAWYAAREVETCLAEVVFHMTRELDHVGDFHAVVDYAEMFASMSGEFLDLMGVDPAEPCFDPEPAIGYPAGNAVADEVRAIGLNGILYPSVRRMGGDCFVALWPHAVQSVAQGAVWRVAWRGEATPSVSQV